MHKDDVYATTSQKDIAHFVHDLEQVAQKYGFVVHNKEKMALATTFAAHGIDVANGFDLHMIQLCKPHKAAKSLMANPERAVLMPKFIMAFSANGTTQIRFLRFSQQAIRALVDDDQFPGSLSESYQTIERIIEEAC